jgi:hypothetical protein
MPQRGLHPHQSVAAGETNGLVKVISETRFGEVLGLHIAAPHASDLIHEGGLALTLEATLEEVTATVHGHPTLGEAVREAALAAAGAAIHLPQRFPTATSISGASLLALHPRPPSPFRPTPSQVPFCSGATAGRSKLCNSVI